MLGPIMHSDWLKFQISFTQSTFMIELLHGWKIPCFIYGCYLLLRAFLIEKCLVSDHLYVHVVNFSQVQFIAKFMIMKDMHNLYFHLILTCFWCIVFFELVIFNYIRYNIPYLCFSIRFYIAGAYGFQD